MRYKENIEKVTAEILAEEINYLALRNALQEFMTWLLDLTKLDLDNSKSREDVLFDNGIALSSTFAALCVVDIMRTRQFVRGIFQAMKQVQNQRTGPVNILYAGTGPFATLILPLLTKYSPEQLRLTLIEANEKTIFYLKKLISELEIDDYISEILCVDASKYKLGEEKKVDILISETMQHGLVKEQQVPIMLNLVNQLEEDVIIIPNKIQLDLALMNNDTELYLTNAGKSKYKEVKTLLEFDSQFIRAHSNTEQSLNRFELCKQLPFSSKGDEEYNLLVILTLIQVYGDTWIDVDASSLTIPKVLFNLDVIDRTHKKISLDYVIKSNPDFEYELS